VGQVVLRLQADVVRFRQTFHRQDFPIVVRISGIDLPETTIKGDIAIVQGVVLGVQGVPVPVYDPVLLGGAGSEQESSHGDGKDKYVAQLQNYRWSCLTLTQNNRDYY